METMEFWIAATVAAVIVGLSKGGIPAIGMLAVPIMALTISPVAAVGMLLPVYLVSDVLGIWSWRRNWSGKVLALIMPGAIAGTLLAWMTAEIVPNAAVTLLIGLLGFFYSAITLLRPDDARPPAQPKVLPGAFWGAVTGFTSFVSYAGSPPFQIYVLPLRLDKATFVGTSTVTFAILNFAKIVPYAMMGQLDVPAMMQSIYMMPPAILAVLAGVRLVKVIPGRSFFRAVIWALLLLSIKLVWDGAKGLGWA